MLPTLLLQSIGAVSSLVMTVSAGQLSQRPAVPAPAPSTQPAKPSSASPLVTKPERKPFANVFTEPAGTKPVLLDVVPAPRVQPGPCGLLILDDRRGIDPNMMVPVPPGNFVIRRIVPETCRGK